MTIISRTFDSSTDANQAVSELRANVATAEPEQTAAPAFDARHLPVLIEPPTDRPGPKLVSGPRTLSEVLGIPELTHNQHGSATLIDNPAPLSSMLGLPVLLRDTPSAR